MEKNGQLVKAVSSLPVEVGTMKKIGFGVGGLAVLGLSATFVLQALAAGLGLFALGGLAVVGFVFYKFSGVFVQKLENRVLLEKKKEAQENPIEQMENGLKEMVDEAEKSEALIKQKMGTLKSFVAKVNAMREKNPNLDCSLQEKQAQTGAADIQREIDEHNARVRGIQILRQDIDRFKDQLELANLQLSLGGSSVDAAKQEERRILMDEAARSIQTKLCRGYSGMEIDASGVLADIQSGEHGKDYRQDGENAVTVDNLGKLEFKLDLSKIGSVEETR